MGSSVSRVQQMQRFFTTLFNQRHVHPDITLVAGETVIPAHRVILSCSSCYFEALFGHNAWLEVGCRSLKVNESICSGGIMMMLVEFAYSQELCITGDNCCDVMVAADYYGFAEAVDKCISYMEERLTRTNCLQVWNFAREFHFQRLQQTAFDYILKGFNDIRGSHEFLNLNEAEFNQIIISEWLNADDLEVKEATVAWHKHRNTKLAHPLKDEIGVSELTNSLPKMGSSAHLNNFSRLRQRLHRTLASSGDASQQIIPTQRYPREVLFAIGGWHEGSPTNHIEAYDIRLRKWSVITHFPDFIDESPRAYHAIVYVDGWMYSIGGFDGHAYYDKVRKYHFERRCWVECSRMYQKRCYVSASYLDGKIYACGGLDGHTRLNTAEEYDIKANSWNHLPAMRYARSDGSSTTFDGKIYICGGFSGQVCMNSVETFTPGQSSWCQISKMISPRSGVVALVHQGLLWAIGGFDGTNRLKSTEYYDGKRWQVGPSMNKERSNFAGSSVGDKIIVCGGYNERGTLRSVESLKVKSADSIAASWGKEEKMNISRSALSSVVLRDLSRDRICQILPRRHHAKSKNALFQVPLLRIPKARKSTFIN